MAAAYTIINQADVLCLLPGDVALLSYFAAVSLCVSIVFLPIKSPTCSNVNYNRKTQIETNET